MSSLLRSTRAKLFSPACSASASLSRTFSSLPRSTHALHSTSPLNPSPQVGALPSAIQLFHRSMPTMSLANENPSKGNLTGELEKLYGLVSLNDPITKLGTDSPSKINNPLIYKASGQDTNVLAGAGAGYSNGSSRVWVAKGPMLLGVNAVMARSFERSADAYTLGLTGHKRFMSDVTSTISETKPYSLRPLSPHLPVYQPQLSSTLSIFNRISGAILSAVILLFYMIYMKMGLISLSYDSFYQFLFYSSKLNLLAVEISALALSYHLYAGIRHLVH